MGGREGVLGLGGGDCVVRISASQIDPARLHHRYLVASPSHCLQVRSQSLTRRSRHGNRDDDDDDDRETKTKLWRRP